jgi:hypothetical protein
MLMPVIHMEGSTENWAGKLALPDAIHHLSMLCAWPVARVSRGLFSPQSFILTLE